MKQGVDYRRAADAARRVLKHLQVDRLPVRPLDMLRRCRDTQVMTYAEAADAMAMTEDAMLRACTDADAVTLRCAEGDRCKYLVCYRAGGNAARLNFTLAHELGHIVLRHRGEAANEEKEADYFAGCLLCPDAAVEMTSSVEELARLCYVSWGAAEKAKARKRFCAEENDLPEIRHYIDKFLQNGARHLL